MTNKERIVKVISEELRIDKDKIVPEANVFDDLNFDSLDSVQVILEIEKEFDIEKNLPIDFQWFLTKLFFIFLFFCFFCSFFCMGSAACGVSHSITSLRFTWKACSRTEHADDVSMSSAGVALLTLEASLTFEVCRAVCSPVSITY